MSLDLPPLDAELDARFAEQLDAHRRRQAARAAVRAELKAARDAGLRARHAGKLARIHAAGPRPGPCGCTTDRWCPQHWQALPAPERRAWRRSHPDQTPADGTTP
jgi:hypothetical protein